MVDAQTKQELELYKKFKQVSISEFFEKNRHLLGFDSPRKALLIAVKELVDNSLDACEEAKILPDIKVNIKERKKGVYEVIVEDNGPGIPPDKVPLIFGSFLFGSKFHRYVSTRGKQGIGASAVVLYGQLTTGRPVVIKTKPLNSEEAYLFEIKIDVKHNKPIVIRKEKINWKKEHGLYISITLKGQYVRGRGSVDEYIQLTALANPHAKIVYINPKGEKVVYNRITNKIPELHETKPHPYGIEIGVLERMLKETKAKTLKDFLKKSFSSIGEKVALEILKKAKLKPNRNPKTLTFDEIERLYEAMQSVKIRAIPSKYIVTMGKDLIIESLTKMFDPDFVVAETKRPAVYRGIPFIVEVGLAYGGSINSFKLLRFANRVPLLYKAGECAITHAVKSINWKRYGLDGKEGEFPNEPLIVMVHVASVWIPFTSESKEAIAPYPEILKEIQLALKDTLRELSVYIKKRKTLEYLGSKYTALYGYGLELARYLSKILNIDDNTIKSKIQERIKQELFEDILDILTTVREVKLLLESNKKNEAVKMIKRMLKEVTKRKILTNGELEELINKAIEKVEIVVKSK